MGKLVLDQNVFSVFGQNSAIWIMLGHTGGLVANVDRHGKQEICVTYFV